jgi:diguanylate cyclase (GGDEF)-like protein
LYGEPLPDDADLVFFLLDIDHFKAVNDEHGHAAGDAVLMQMRGRLQQVFRAADHLVRWGGEEFLIVTVGTARAHAAELAERARASVADSPFPLDDGSLLHKTCSIGFACFPLAADQPRALDWATMVKLADEALYRVKHEGRDGWLGAISAQAASEPALRTLARGTLDAWQASGQLQLAGSRPVAPVAAG